eukprot:scaffold1163_cov362-Prasinococcus_capsulatus_cf.AAC.6
MDEATDTSSLTSASCELRVLVNVDPPASRGGVAPQHDASTQVHLGAVIQEDGAPATRRSAVHSVHGVIQAEAIAGGARAMYQMWKWRFASGALLDGQVVQVR